ncbi:MAG: hypothetical protein U1E45_04895 [Geminicoccaceae bacterium]
MAVLSLAVWYFGDWNAVAPAKTSGMQPPTLPGRDRSTIVVAGWLTTIVGLLPDPDAILRVLPLTVMPFLLWHIACRWRAPGRPVLVRRPDPGTEKKGLRPPNESLRLFGGGDISWTAQALRAHRLVPSTRLDVAATAHATAAAGGYLVPVMGHRPRLPDYPIVVESASAADHVMALAKGLAARLVEGQVHCALYGGSGDLRYLRSEREEKVRLADLSVRHQGDVLLTVGDGTAFLDAGAERPSQAAIEALEQWPIVVLLTPIPLRRWSWRERRLAEAGMVVLPATPAGLAVLADFLRAGDATEPPRPALLRRPVWPGPLARESRSSRRWHGDARPEAGERDAVLDAIAIEVPAATLELLRVLALFPEARPDLTLHVAGALAADGPSPLLLDEEAFGALAALPWFRFGRIPDWLRAELVRDLSPERLEQARDIYKAWLYPTESADTPWVYTAEGFGKAIRAAAASDADSPLRDVIFLKFSRGESLDDVELEAPEALARELRPSWYSAERLGIIAAAGASLGILALAPQLVGWLRDNLPTWAPYNDYLTFTALLIPGPILWLWMLWRAQIKNNGQWPSVTSLVSSLTTTALFLIVIGKGKPEDIVILFVLVIPFVALTLLPIAPAQRATRWPLPAHKGEHAPLADTLCIMVGLAGSMSLFGSLFTIPLLPNPPSGFLVFAFFAGGVVYGTCVSILYRIWFQISSRCFLIAGPVSFASAVTLAVFLLNVLAWNNLKPPNGQDQRLVAVLVFAIFYVSIHFSLIIVLRAMGIVRLHWRRTGLIIFIAMLPSAACIAVVLATGSTLVGIEWWVAVLTAAVTISQAAPILALWPPEHVSVSQAGLRPFALALSSGDLATACLLVGAGCLATSLGLWQLLSYFGLPEVITIFILGTFTGLLAFLVLLAVPALGTFLLHPLPPQAAASTRTRLLAAWRAIVANGRRSLIARRNTVFVLPLFLLGLDPGIGVGSLSSLYLPAAVLTGLCLGRGGMALIVFGASPLLATVRIGDIGTTGNPGLYLTTICLFMLTVAPEFRRKARRTVESAGLTRLALLLAALGVYAVVELLSGYVELALVYDVDDLRWLAFALLGLVGARRRPVYGAAALVVAVSALVAWIMPMGQSASSIGLHASLVFDRPFVGFATAIVIYEVAGTLRANLKVVEEVGAWRRTAMTCMLTAALLTSLTLLTVDYPAVLGDSPDVYRKFGEQILGNEVLIVGWAVVYFRFGMAGMARLLPVRRMAGGAAVAVVVIVCFLLVAGVMHPSGNVLGSAVPMSPLRQLMVGKQGTIVSFGPLELGWRIALLPMMLATLTGIALGMFSAAAFLGHLGPQMRRNVTGVDDAAAAPGGGASDYVPESAPLLEEPFPKSAQTEPRERLPDAYSPTLPGSSTMDAGETGARPRQSADADLLTLAAEYESVREIMSSGDARTRRMTEVFRAMQRQAPGASDLLPDLMSSRSPGQRLGAIAVLEQHPSAEHLGWLADRLDIDIEKPFVGYQAARALLAAVNVLPLADCPQLEEALLRASTFLRRVPATSDRARTLYEAEQMLQKKCGGTLGNQGPYPA